MSNIDPNYFNIDKEQAMRQNKVEDILEPQEKILARVSPDKKDYILESIFKGLPIALLWGGIDAFIIVQMVSVGALVSDAGMEGFPLWLFLILFFGLHLIPVWAYVASVIKRVVGYKNIEYVFTDKRVILRSGLVGIDFKFAFYSQISAVTVKVGLWDRLFKVGDITITSVGQNMVLEDIHHPYEFTTKIQKIAQDIKADISFPNDLRPKTNHGYNTEYTDK